MATCIDSSRCTPTENFSSTRSCCTRSPCRLPTWAAFKIPPCSPSTMEDLWVQLRDEAHLDAIQEPLLFQYYSSLVFSHTSLEAAMANLLSTKLSTPDISLHRVFSSVLEEDSEIRTAIRYDLKAVRERDPACTSYVHCFLHLKGFHACQAHRVAHKLWSQGRTVLALVIQSQVSEAFGVDIHPGAKLGKGIVLDHATSIVIGETAVVGDGVTILHNVTLGSSGKERIDRHPKIGNGVFIGAGTKVLGNIRVGDGAKIGAGSVVLKQVPSNTTAVGNPARVISTRQKNNTPIVSSTFET